MRIIWALWFVWYLYWAVSARNRIRSTDTSEARRESGIGRLIYMGLMIAGFVLLAWQVPQPFLGKRLWPSAGVWLSVGLGIEAAGLVFAVWARRTLGKNWTARITTGGTQELIIRGPYKIVRHPIYSGLLFAILGTAIVIGQVRGFVGFLIVLIGVLIKLRREETALRRHFGSGYRDYAKQVPALVPGWPSSSSTMG
jgi:protein-S-isoprenylcysteine O-methyltransferase Ste14